MRARLLVALPIVAFVLALAFTPAAQAYNNGRGFYGATNDVIVTNAGYLLIIFFPTFIFIASMIQRALDKRKEARKAAQGSQLSNGRWLGGW